MRISGAACKTFLFEEMLDKAQDAKAVDSSTHARSYSRPQVRTPRKEG